MNRLTAILTCVTLLSLVAVASACPNCVDTIANTDAGDDAAALAAGFTYSIYAMLLGFFAVVGMVVHTIYKGVRSADLRHADPSRGRIV